MRTLLILAASSLPLAAWSQQPAAPAGGAVQLTTVDAILNNPQDDQIVRLRGRIVSAVRGDTYVFADDSGQINIEIDDDIPRDRIAIGADVEIVGEVDAADDDGDEGLEVEVERITPL
ncbi:MAG: NirD/YgiW/YdeI family stress tolerance protein [Pseudomonadota bacterium]|jgi:Uncharacterized conserved protein